MKDYTGPNTLLSAFRLIRQAIKNSILSAGDGIDITETAEGPKIGVTTPVQGIVTQAEFDALPEEQQNKGFYVISDGDGGGGGGESAGEVYSTEEQRIGTWIDGKPLYRRVLYKEYNTDLDSISFMFAIPDIDTLVDANLFFKGRGNNHSYLAPFYSTSSLFCFIRISSSGYFDITQNGLSEKIIQSANAIAEYTKTTDTATVSTAEIAASLAEAADNENAGQEVTQ